MRNVLLQGRGKGSARGRRVLTSGYLKENERKILMRAPAHVHSARAAPCCWGKPAADTQPALRTGLMAPAWRPALYIWGCRAKRLYLHNCAKLWHLSHLWSLDGVVPVTPGRSLPRQYPLKYDTTVQLLAHSHSPRAVLRCIIFRLCVSQVAHVIARSALQGRAAPHARQGWPPSHEQPCHRQVGLSRGGSDSSRGCCCGVGPWG